MDILRLYIGKLSELSPKGSKMEPCDFLVEVLGQLVEFVGVLAGVTVGPEFDLGHDLVGEGVGHHEGGVPRRAAQVHQPPFCEQDDASPVGEHEPVHLRLNVLPLDVLVGDQSGQVDLVVEVADVADDRVVLHFLHVLDQHDVAVARGSHEDVDLFDHAFFADHLVSLHAGLQGTNRVNLSHIDDRSSRRKGTTASLPDIPIPKHQTFLTRDEHIDCSVQPVKQ
jgi:hypothetical protein